MNGKVARMICAVAGLLASMAGEADASQVIRDLIAKDAATGTRISYSVYLPYTGPDADDTSVPSFPVVYLLHGFGASSNEWIERLELAKTLDAAIATGRIAPVIAVMPDAGKSWYVDSVTFGDVETAIMAALIPEIDRRFSTKKDARARAIAGLSMGGFGALRLAFKYPDSFAAVAALSAGLFKPGGVSWQHGPDAARRRNVDHWYGGTFGSPFDIDLYIAESPFSYVSQIAAAASPPEILLIVGDDDWFGSYDGTLEMFLDLRAAGLKPELRVADGGHDGRLWRRMIPGTFSIHALEQTLRLPVGPASA